MKKTLLGVIASMGLASAVALTATNDVFKLKLTPRVEGITEVVDISFPVTSSNTYYVQVSENLMNSNEWKTVKTLEYPTGTNGFYTSNTDSSNKYFRVLRE